MASKRVPEPRPYGAAAVGSAGRSQARHHRQDVSLLLSGSPCGSILTEGRLMYSATVLEQFHNPHNLGLFENPDVLGRAGMPGEGPYLAIALCLADGHIAAASFESYGCPSAIASGSWLTQW